MARKNGSSHPEANAAVGPHALPAAPLGRASWSGFLQWNLVVVPIKAYPAVGSSETLTFHQLHADCGQRIHYHKVCPVHGKVEAEAILRGYQYAPDQYVVIETAELDRLRPAKDQGLVLAECIDLEQIDPARFSGRSLHLLPEGLPAQRPYRILCQTLQACGKAALGRVVLSGHRQVALVRPSGKLLTMHLLHEPSQVRSATALETVLRDGEAQPEEQQLAARLIDTATVAAIDWAKYRDDTAEQLTALIEAKIAGRQWVLPAEEPPPVLPLLDALKQSVAATQGKTHTLAIKPQKRSVPARRRSA